MTVTPVYSIAKIFTAAAVLRCLDPEREIGAVAPVPARLAGLRVGDLLTHRSGLGDYGAWPEYRRDVAERGDAWSEEVILERVELARPGVFRYSNPGYLLVRRALEEQHGDRFFPVLRRLVLDPLELPAHPFASRADWAHCTVEIPVGVRAYDPRWVYPGTFCADVTDTAAALARLLSGTLGAELPTAMCRTHPVDAPGHPLSDPGYGAGLMTSGNPPAIVGHGGGGPGFTLFAAARVDGSAAHGTMEARECDDAPLIRRCLAALR
ncbi:serine hydrolase domain-containing protein [Nocardia farcinica]|uniref:serine hydrolase domain-containing protein n=1 Tax=Nocardia farcinica TaxID=37329 RepID=UPI000761C28A|nr:serine hydrolase domain-containing protein [Nocardia farcinica]